MVVAKIQKFSKRFVRKLKDRVNHRILANYKNLLIVGGGSDMGMFFLNENKARKLLNHFCLVGE